MPHRSVVPRLLVLLAALVALLAFSAPSAYATHVDGCPPDTSDYNPQNPGGDPDDPCKGGERPINITAPEMNDKMEVGGRAIIFNECERHRVKIGGVYCSSFQTSYSCGRVGPTGPFGVCAASFIMFGPDEMLSCTFSILWFKATTTYGDIYEQTRTEPICTPIGGGGPGPGTT